MAFQKVEFEFPEDDDDNKMVIEETSAVEIDITGKKTAEDFAADEAPADKPESKKDSDDDDLEIEVVDDTPKADRNRKPSEPPEDVTDEELEKYSEQVQKRIKHFTKGYHDERRAKEEAPQKQKELNCRVYFVCYDKLMYWECNDIRGKQNKEWFIKRNVYLPIRKTYGDCVCVRKEYLKEETNTINSSMCMNTAEKKKSLKTIKEQEEKMRAFYEQQQSTADLLFLTDSEDET